MLLKKNVRFFALIALFVSIVGIAFAATFGITGATWTQSTLRWKIVGAGQLSAKTDIFNTFTGDYYGTVKGNATTGAWSQTNTVSSGSTELVPCELYARQGLVTERKLVSTPPVGCLGPNSEPYYGLISSYTFDETSGATSFDYSSLNNATLIGGATRTTAGKYGSAISFNGSSGRVEISDNPSLDLKTGMTLEAWVYPTVSGGWRTIVLKETSGDLIYALYQNELGYPAVWVNRTVQVASGTKLPVNVWTHVAGTYDGKILRLYVNGVQKKTIASSSTIESSAGLLSIGGNTVWGEYFQGKIDDVRVYNRALSPAEIISDKSNAVDVRVVNFDNPIPYFAKGTPIGLYSQINFGALNAVWNSGPYAGINSNYLYSASGVGYFTLVRPEKLISVDLSSVSNGTAVISDEAGQTKTISLTANTPVKVVVNWSNVSSEIRWNASGPLAIDNLVFKRTSSSGSGGGGPIPPTVSVTANPASVIEGNSSLIAWSSTNATACSAPWTANTGTSGSESVTPAVSFSYSVTCTGAGGSATGNVNVSVIPKPTVSLSANPSTVLLGDSSVLTWNSANANSCSAPWTASTSTSGSASVTPSAISNYSITCTGAGGSVTKDVIIVVTTPTSYTVNLAWDFAPTPTDGTVITGYCVYMSTTPGWPYTNPQEKCVDAATNTTTMSFSQGGTKYFSAITTGTKDGVNGVSGPSNEVSKNF